MIYQAVTTCNAEQWKQYGRAMAATFARHWPAAISLTVYAEGFSGEQQNGRVRFVDLDAAAPWLAAWKDARSLEQHGGAKRNFRFDAVRFVHKVAAICAAAKQTEGVLVWLDADIVTHSPVTMKWLDILLPQDADMAWLDRTHTYPECGVMMFRLPGPAARMLKTLRVTYKTGAIFKLPEWHDSYVIQSVVQHAVKRGEIKVASLSGKGRNYHHVLPNSPLGDCLDHLKGKRKMIGRTPAHERMLGARSGYWK